MNVAHFIIKGRVPSKKNSRNVFVRRGKPVNIPSDKYREWHEQATIQLLQSPRKIRCLSACEVQMEWYMPDNRKCDLTNKAESVMDLLVDCKIITDDRWQIVPRIMLNCRGIDRLSPRVEIWIKEII